MMWNYENPFRRSDDLQRQVNELFGALLGNSPLLERCAFVPGEAARAYPRLNVAEDADNVYVEAVVPGIDPKELDVSVLGDRLTVSGEKKASDDGVAREKIHRTERAAGKFIRTITLPSEVDPDQVKAEYAHGILKITLAKQAAAKPRQIEVKVQ